MKTILCFGDSNTNGCTPEFDIRDWKLDGKENAPVRYPREERWTGILAELLGPEYYVIEEGLPGRTTVFDDGTAPFKKGSDYIVPCMQTHAPIDLLVIMLGTNDVKCLFAPSKLSVGLAMEEFLKIVRNPALWDGRQAGRILLVAPPPIGEHIETSTYYGIYSRESVKVSGEFARIYGGIARLYGCDFLNAGDYIESSPCDSIHFSKESHRKLAEAMHDKIKEIVG